MRNLFNEIEIPTEHQREILSSKSLGVCEHCHNEVIKADIKRPSGEVVKITYGCTCDEIKKFKENQRNMIVQKYVRSSILPLDYDKKMLRDYIPGTQSQQQAKNLAINYIKNSERAIDEGMNFTLLGTTGTGKTHIALSIFNQLIKERKTVLFLVVTDYYNLLKESYDQKNNYDNSSTKKIENITTLAKKADVLILDDVGANKMTDWANEQLFDLINARIGKSTIMTSNYSEKHLESELEFNRWLSRLRENGVVHTIIGNDQRAKKQIQKFGEN